MRSKLSIIPIVKKQDIKNSAKRIVNCAIENNVAVSVRPDSVDEKYTHILWGDDLYNFDCMECFCIGVDLEFHIEQTEKIIKSIKTYAKGKR